MKYLRIVLFLALVVCTLGGCQQGAAVKLRIESFEVSSLVLDHFIPPPQRPASAQSAYFVAPGQGALASDLLFQGIKNDAGLLYDGTLEFRGGTNGPQTVNYPEWPGINPVRGTLTGSAAVRNQLTKKTLHLDFQITHSSRSPDDRPTISSRIVYDGPIPRDSLIFVAPFQRANGDQRAHVLVMHVTAR
jgi:hypothetical protein